MTTMREMRTAAVASLGAGAIHATAAGAHGEHPPAAVMFAVLAVLQGGWGAAALRARASRPLAWAGVALGWVGLTGWALAKVSGIGFVTGLEAAEPPGFADTVAAVLAGVTLGGAAWWLSGRSDPVGARRPAQVPGAVTAAALVLAAMVATGDHDHTGGDHGHGLGESAAAHGPGDGGGHDHGATAGDHDDDGDGAHGGAAGDGHGGGDHGGGGGSAAAHDHGGGRRGQAARGGHDPGDHDDDPDDPHDHDDDPGDPHHHDGDHGGDPGDP
ncbi:MAG TPA: hypothetical protein VFI47_05175, partial [Acidimicrobiales bacterium]|nr:hypothetical protein [Acidimicrobiales bacterium]